MQKYVYKYMKYISVNMGIYKYTRIYKDKKYMKVNTHKYI